MSSWSESAQHRRAVALHHFQPGSTRSFPPFLLLAIVKQFCAGPAALTSSAREVAEGSGFLNRTADSYAS